MHQKPSPLVDTLLKLVFLATILLVFPTVGLSLATLYIVFRTCVGDSDWDEPVWTDPYYSRECRY